MSVTIVLQQPNSVSLTNTIPNAVTINTSVVQSVWGDIVGTLTDQNDLTTYVAGRTTLNAVLDNNPYATDSTAYLGSVHIGDTSGNGYILEANMRPEDANKIVGVNGEGNGFIYIDVDGGTF